MTNRRQDGVARVLGWFSIGLGLAEVAAPGAMARLIGVPGSSKLLRCFGVREIASGMAIFLHDNREEAVWSRVGGDAVDLAFLGASHLSRSVDRDRLLIATAAVAGVTGLDVVSALRLRREQRAGAVRTQSITINRPPAEVYRFWRNFENLPRFMSHLVSARPTGEKRSHWVVKAPAGRTVEWDAEIVEDKPDEKIAWRSLKGADVENAGYVLFRDAPGGRGTEIHARIEYNPPGGAFGAAIAKLFGEEPGEQLKGDLYRFKQVIETGEVVHSDASIHEGMYPAVPSPSGSSGQSPHTGWTH